MTDIQWLEHMEDGLATARKLKRPLVLMPVGQGMDGNDTWCPAASHTRANFAHPDIVRLIERAFVPVRFSMHIHGPGLDEAGRSFVVKQPASGPFDIFPADVFIISPESEVLGRLPFDSTGDEIIETLTQVLRARLDLTTPEVLAQPAPTDPAEIALRSIEERYKTGTPDRNWWKECVTLLFHIDDPRRSVALPPQPEAHKADLVPELEEWLSEYAESHAEHAALARILLGGARAHAGDAVGARQAWESVLTLHPTHSLRHRASYNLIEPGAFPSLPLTDVVGAKRPSAVEAGILVPDPARRERNLASVQSDPRYQHLLPGLPFVRLEAGSFMMGGAPAKHVRELPRRRVTITRPFLISAWPVTRAVYREMRPDAYPGAEHEGLAGMLPAVRFSWLEMVELCEFLTKREGRRYRLPTEAEWEYAARGGLEGTEYPWGDEAPDHDRCNYVHPHPVPVASYPPNGFGLFDSVGNSLEWCADYYTKDAYSRTALEVDDPTGPDLATAIAASPTGDAARVARGNGWLGNEMCHINCRISWRIGWPEGYRWCNLGARLVVDVDEP